MNAIRHLVYAMIAGAMFLTAPVTAAAAEPAALVEDVLSGLPGVAVMQFLDTGDTVELGTDGEVILSYLASCVRETVTGGKITVGERQSSISGGLVVREKVNCDTDQLILTSSQSNESGVVAFRAAAGGDPVVTIYGTRPVFVFDEIPSEIVIERRDRKVANFTIAPDSRIFDLAETDISLFPNGIYKASSGEKSITIRVDPAARASQVPVISRLVRF
ncbi:MAG: hypothetical protein ABJ215_16060 [Alphaproteobacteria bacterium]